MDLRTTVTLLPTPRSQDGNGYQQSPTADIGNNGHTVSLADRVTRLLPTPNAQDGNGGGRFSGKPGSGHQTTLPGEVRLLPTPKARDGGQVDCPSERQRHTPGLSAVDHYLLTPTASDCTGGGQDPDRRVGHTSQLIDEVLTTQWGKYAPAIACWERIVGPAPEPTEPNKNGNPRLSAAFSQWLMGWPAGWVTDPAIGISRNDQLKIVGNGVCSQQAAAALRQLLAVTGGIPVSTPTIQPATELLPTPCVVDRLATTDMTLEQWDESRRSQKERGVGSFGPRGDSLGAAVLRVEEGTVDQRPDFSTRSKGR